MAPWRGALQKFWAPVPWMLEAAILLQLALGEYVEGAPLALIAGILAAAIVFAFVLDTVKVAVFARLKMV